jgi:hypothetical protein
MTLGTVPAMSERKILRIFFLASSAVKKANFRPGVS